MRRGERASGRANADKVNMPIDFQYDCSKATQAILWLLSQHGGVIYKLSLVKLIFLADRAHLAKYGRPIVGGQYVAMKHGPVGSELLDYLSRAVEGSGLPFQVVGIWVRASQPASEEELSESDIRVLHEIDAQYGNCDRFALRNLTHGKAWQKNYPNPNENTSRPLPYEDFFLDLDDAEMLDIIREHQEAMGF